MKISVKNLGAIKSAEIDLSKKLTVFCGPNGTGKTYLAYLIYAITSIDNKNIGEKFNVEKVNQLISDNITSLSVSAEELWKFRNLEIKNVRDTLGNIFAISDNKAEKYFTKTEIRFSESLEGFKKEYNEKSISQNISLFGHIFNISKNEGSDNITVSIIDSKPKSKDLIQVLHLVFLSRVYSILAYHPVVSSTIFPVERNSIYTFNEELSIRNNDRYEMIKELSSNKHARPIDLLLKRTVRYPLAIRDGLRVADDLETIQKQNSTYHGFASELETELLKGSVSITKEGNVEFTSNKAPRAKLSFHQSSSIVKTLSSLVIYLKHLASEGDLLIIDEPELNLHPENQIKLARIFTRLVHNGLRISISTHSDYIVRELNNLVMVSSLRADESKKELLANLGYKDDEYINIEDLNAYSFNFKIRPKVGDEEKNSEVKLIHIDESGFDVKTLDDTIDQLNNRSEELYYHLKYANSDE